MKSSSQKGAEEKGGKKRMQRTQNMKEKQNLPLKLHPSSLCSSSVIHRPSQDKTRRDPLQTPWISFLWYVLFFLGALLFCVLRSALRFVAFVVRLTPNPPASKICDNKENIPPHLSCPDCSSFCDLIAQGSWKKQIVGEDPFLVCGCPKCKTGLFVLPLERPSRPSPPLSTLQFASFHISSHNSTPHQRNLKTMLGKKDTKTVHRPAPRAIHGRV